jgi:hypothetical protein
MYLTRCPIAIVLESGSNISDLERTIHHRNSCDIHVRLNTVVLRDKGG